MIHSTGPCCGCTSMLKFKAPVAKSGPNHQLSVVLQHKLKHAVLPVLLASWNTRGPRTSEPEVCTFHVFRWLHTWAKQMSGVANALQIHAARFHNVLAPLQAVHGPVKVSSTLHYAELRVGGPSTLGKAHAAPSAPCQERKTGPARVLFCSSGQYPCRVTQAWWEMRRPRKLLLARRCFPKGMP